ncbi:SMI1/KNR4 family protein [Sphingomonas sp. PB4P5]|uniref:SMI1/KNR4 family protein n=1 Tax=Parasphingomonas puruogangriensis TaxID=3096155 RepID=UPI002FC99989
MNYLPLLEARAEPAPDEDRTRLEAMVQAIVPGSYWAFLSQSNGGHFRDHIVTIPGDDTVLNYVYSTRAPSYNIFDDYAMLRSMDRIPMQSLPFADDPAGNIFIVSVEPGTHGQIFFWGHEREPEDGGTCIADFPNMTFVADDFAAFIANLKPDEAGS